MELQCLFVYGTLAKGRINSHVLESIGGTWQKASVKGKLVEKGWGAEKGYPGLILDSLADQIDGYVFCSTNLGSHWKMLDEFEGPEYERIITKVLVEDGANIDAFVYVVRA